MGLLGDMKDVVDEQALMEKFAPALTAFEGLLIQIAKSPLASSDGFTVTITVTRKETPNG